MNSFVAKLDYGDVLAIDDKNNGNTNPIMVVTGFYWTNNYGGRNLPLLSAHTGDVVDQRIEDTDLWRNGTWNNLWFIRPIN